MFKKEEGNYINKYLSPYVSAINTQSQTKDIWKWNLLINDNEMNSIHALVIAQVFRNFRCRGNCCDLRGGGTRPLGPCAGRPAGGGGGGGSRKIGFYQVKIGFTAG